MALLTLAAPASVFVGTPASGATEAGGVTATFEGTAINLGDGWGDAQACIADASETRCYRTEDELALAESQTLAAPSAPAALLTSCSTSVRLYSGTSYTGSVLYLSTQYYVYNLSNYGFNNITSSYKVGACSAYFYDGAGLGAPIYPGSTSAHSWSSTMAAGWDNRISSVYIT